MINPYVTEFPADPKYFAGRGKELGEIKKAIDYTVFVYNTIDEIANNLKVIR